MESKKVKKYWFKNFASLNYETKKFTCLVETCKKELSAASSANLKRHYKLVHNMIIDGLETLPKCIETKSRTKLKAVLDTEKEFLECNESKESNESYESIESKKRKKFCFEKYASFNNETNKFTCLLETCKRELSAASNSNLKRHYKLVHNMIIGGEETPPNSSVKIKLHTALNRKKFLKSNGRTKRKRFNFKNFASFNYETKKMTCLIETCKKVISGSNIGNLKRHYKLVHNMDIDGMETLPKSFKTKITTATLNADLNTEEFLECNESHESNKRKKFCFKKFASYNYETKKFICLVETCKKEVSAVTGNLKRHYKLVHNMIIDGDETLSTSIVKKTTINKLHTDLNREEFLKCCIGLVSKKNMPLRMFDDKDFFKKIIEPYEEKFDITLNSKNISNVLGDSSEEIKKAIAKIVENKMICLKIDVASRQNKYILGVNIQYVCDFKICINTIGIIPLNKKLTAQYLKEEIMNCLEEYNIDVQQIYSYTIDSGANVVKVSNLQQEMQDDSLMMTDETEYDNTKTYEAIETQLSSVFSVVRCAAHAIQLAANDVIKTLETEIKDVRNIAKVFRSVLKARNQDISLPCLDDPARWISTYDMIISILNLKGYIIELDDESIDISVNWMFVESFATAFKPLAKCTIHMQKEQYIIGDFFRDWLECELDLEDMIQINSYAEALHKAMAIRKLTLLEYDAFVAALYLDPRFNFQGTPLLTNHQKQAAVDHLIKTYEIINQVSDSPSSEDENESISFSESTISLDSTPSTSNAAHSKLAQHINRSLLTQKNQNYDIKTELMALCDKRMEPLETNVLQYWKQISQRNSKLSQLAEVVLAVPVTQASVERAFIALATVLTKLKSKLSKKSISNILITKLNFHLLNCSALKIENSE